MKHNHEQAVGVIVIHKLHFSVFMSLGSPGTAPVRPIRGLIASHVIKIEEPVMSPYMFLDRWNMVG